MSFYMSFAINGSTHKLNTRVLEVPATMDSFDSSDPSLPLYLSASCSPSDSEASNFDESTPMDLSVVSLREEIMH